MPSKIQYYRLREIYIQSNRHSTDRSYNKLTRIKENSRTCVKPFSSQGDLRVTEVPPSHSAKAPVAEVTAKSGALVAGSFNHSARVEQVPTFRALFCLPSIC